MQFKPHLNSAFSFVQSATSDDKGSTLVRSQLQEKQNNSNQIRLNCFLDFHKLLLQSEEFSEVKKQTNYQNRYKEQNYEGSFPLYKEEQQNKTNGLYRKVSYNDTKNIPKNFGKAIIGFIQKNPDPTRKCLEKYGIEYASFMDSLKKKKKCLHSIRQLRAVWLDSEFQFSKPLRELSIFFMKKSSLKYIFGSRVVDYTGHLKYRKRIISALENPLEFHSIKTF